MVIGHSGETGANVASHVAMVNIIVNEHAPTQLLRTMVSSVLVTHKIPGSALWRPARVRRFCSTFVV